ncbi:germin-like protein subfamily 1 member 7 [Quercus suber]|uniref:Germin-like protein n=1 Tax=Quercus suber TaxID=58331 RepID=A0AAW0JRJ8_QUESU
MVDANDFSSSGLHIAGNTSNPAGSKLTPMTAALIPGLNSLGISLVHSDYAPWGINPPHTHPRATEILIVLEGSLEVGFFMSNPQNRLITKVLQKGDVFVFPIGLIHYQRNVGIGNVIAIAALSSQNPGVITIANAVFGSKPHIPSDILMKAFQMASPILFFGLLAFIFTTALASDPSPLQDFCVANTNSQVLLNGFACNDPKIAEASDFSNSGLQMAGNT